MINDKTENIKNKAMTNENQEARPVAAPAPASAPAPVEPVETKNEQPGYFFPTHGVTIQAASEEEAQTKFQDYLATIKQ